MSVRKTAKSGFTLIEALTASLILGIGVVALAGICQRCTHNYIRGLQYETAYRLLDECLDLSVSVDLEKLITEKTIQGSFAPRYPQYRFAVNLEPAPGAHLYLVKATVSWDVDQYPYKVECWTEVYHSPGSSTALQGRSETFPSLAD